MKKNIIFILTFAFLAFAVISCGDKEAPKEETEPIEEAQPQEVQPQEVQTPEVPPVPEMPEIDETKIESEAPPAKKIAEVKKPAKKEPKAEKTKPTTRDPNAPIMGRIVSLNKIIASADGAINKVEAKQLLKRKQLIVFQEGSSSNGKIYFVYNADGSFAGKKLAKLSDNKMIGIIGTKKTIKGTSIIIADKIMTAQ